MFDARFVDQARRDLAALLAANPELEEDDVLRLDMVEGNTNALELLDELIRAERNAKALAEGINSEIDRLVKREARLLLRQQTIRKYMMQLMEAAGLKKAERPAATVSITTGRPKVIITDESQLHDCFWRVKREPDKTAIAEALKFQGAVVPGATLSNSEPTIRIS